MSERRPDMDARARPRFVRVFVPVLATLLMGSDVPTLDVSATGDSGGTGPAVLQRGTADIVVPMSVEESMSKAEVLARVRVVEVGPLRYPTQTGGPPIRASYDQDWDYLLSRNGYIPVILDVEKALFNESSADGFVLGVWVPDNLHFASAATKNLVQLRKGSTGTAFLRRWRPIPSTPQQKILDSYLHDIAEERSVEGRTYIVANVVDFYVLSDAGGMVSLIYGGEPVSVAEFDQQVASFATHLHSGFPPRSPLAPGGRPERDRRPLAR